MRTATTGIETLEVLILVVTLMKLGLFVSGLAYVGYRFDRWRGEDTTDYWGYRETFDRWFTALLFRPVSSLVSRLTNEPQKEPRVMRVFMTLAVLTIAVGIEITGMLTVAGVAVAGYHYQGVIPFDVQPTLRSIVAFATIVTISLLSYADTRIEQAYENS